MGYVFLSAVNIVVLRLILKIYKGVWEGVRRANMRKAAAIA